MQVQPSVPETSFSFYELVRWVSYTVLRKVIGLLFSLCLFCIGICYLTIDCGTVVFRKVHQFIEKKHIRISLGFHSNAYVKQLCARSVKPPRDANAGFVSFCRYLAASHIPFNLDSQLQRYESFFLSKIGYLCAAFMAQCCPPLLHYIVEEQILFLSCRTALCDYYFQDALQHGVRQIIILGAGYDTRAYRFAQQRHRHLPDGTSYVVTVLEIDRGVVQNRKRQLLRQGLPSREEYQFVTEGVEFISCDFNCRDALRNVLQHDSKLFNPAAPTYVLWEGVTYYLPEQTIRDVVHTLRDVQQSSELGGWSLSFDFTDPRLWSPTAPTGARLLLRLLQSINEPLVTGLPSVKEDLNHVLEPTYFRTVKLWSCFEIAARFFPNLEYARSNITLFIAHCEWGVPCSPSKKHKNMLAKN